MASMAFFVATTWVLLFMVNCNALSGKHTCLVSHEHGCNLSYGCAIVVDSRH